MDIKGYRTQTNRLEQMSTRRPKNFNNGKIYQLVNDIDDRVYVGHSTTTLRQRFYSHKQAAKVHPERRVYKHMNLMGFEHFRIELIENWPCSNEEELIAREGHWIRQMDTYKNGLNSNLAGRSGKAYREDNKIAICLKTKAWKAANKTKVLEYRADHKAEQAQYQKAYRAARKAQKAQQNLNETTELALTTNTTEAS